MDFIDYISPYLEKSAENTFYINYQKGDCYNFLGDIKYLYGFNYLIDIFANDFLDQETFNDGFRFQINIHLRNLSTNKNLIIKIKLNDCSQFDCFDLWGNSTWPQREMYDLYGLKVREGLNRLLTSRNFKGHAFKKDFVFEEDKPEDIINIDDIRNKTVIYNDKIKERWIELPAHLSGDANFYKMLVDVYQDKIQRLKLEVGYTHKGIEKTLEGLNPVQACNIVDDISPQSLSQTSMLYSMGVENLLGIKVSERVQIIRMILAEFGRISDHMYSLINFFKVNEQNQFLDDCIKIKDRVHLLCQRISGNRFLRGFNCIGGLKSDIPLGWPSDCIDFVTVGMELLSKRVETLTASKFLFEYVEDKGIDPSVAIDLGITGPLLRSSGINYDIRRSNPYYLYDELDFQVPIGINGQSYDLMLIKFIESIQSMRIIVQLLDNIPAGKISTFANDKAFFHIAEIMREQKDSSRRDVIESVESSNGEMILHLIRSNEDFFTRVRFRTPSYVNLQSVETIAKGLELETYTHLSTLGNFLISEVDR